MFTEMAVQVAKVGSVTFLGGIVLDVLDGNKFHAKMVYVCGASVAGIEVAKYVVWRAATTPDWVLAIRHVGDFITNLPFIN